MQRYIDKLMLIAISSTTYYFLVGSEMVITPILISVIALGVTEIFKWKILPYCLLISYIPLLVFYPQYALIATLSLYDLKSVKSSLLTPLLLIPPLIAQLYTLSIFAVIITILTIALSIKTLYLEKLEGKLFLLEDTSKLAILKYKISRDELLQKQQLQVELTKLEERNRIAREIHDGIGHTLSGSILQVGALIVTCKNSEMKEQLTNLKESLYQGMDTIRNSVHDLHEDIIIFEDELHIITDSFTFCEISVHASIKNHPKKATANALLAIVKECLSNIIKHSNASLVNVDFVEHSAFYRLIVKDNGTKQNTQNTGLGIKSMHERVQALNGYINIDNINGYKILVTLKKELHRV